MKISKREMKRAVEVANDEASKFHDGLVLQFLKWLEEHDHRQDEKVKEVREGLNKKWKEYCTKKKFTFPGSKRIFNDQCERILKSLDDVERQSKAANVKLTLLKDDPEFKKIEERAVEELTGHVIDNAKKFI